MISNLKNALDSTMDNAGGTNVLSGTVLQAYNQPIWYVNFLTRMGGTLLLEVVWRDGGIVGSVLNVFKMSENTVKNIVDSFLLKVVVSDDAPVYNWTENIEYSNTPSLGY